MCEDKLGCDIELILQTVPTDHGTVGSDLAWVWQAPKINQSVQLAKDNDLLGQYIKKAREFQGASNELNLVQQEQTKIFAQGASPALQEYIKNTETANLDVDVFTATQKEAAAATTGMSTAMKAMLANMAIAFVVSELVNIITALAQREGKLAVAAKEGAQAFSGESKSIEEQISSVEDLQSKLDAGNLSQDEAISVRQQLLAVQDQLIDKYGKEASSINFLTGNIKDNISAMRELAAQNASEYLTKNSEAIGNAEKALAARNRYTLGMQVEPGTIGSADAQQAFLNLLSGYSNKGIGYLSNSDGQLTIYLDADASSAEKVLTQFGADLRQLKKDYGATFDESWIADGLSQAQGTIDKYRATAEQAAIARVIENPQTSDLYFNAIDAVKAYNNAFVANDQTQLTQTKENVEAIQRALAAIYQHSPEYRNVFDNLFGQMAVDTNAAKSEMRTEMSRGAYGGLASSAKGMTDSQFLKDNTTEAFKAGQQAAKEYGISLEDVANVLVSLGILTRDLARDAKEISFTKLSEQLSTLESKLGTLNAAQDEFNKYGELSADTFKNLVDNDLLQYLDFSGKKLIINKQALYDQAEAAKVAAINDLQMAAATDIQNLAIGNTSGLSDIAKSAISGFGNNAATAGTQAATAAGQIAAMGAALQATIAAASGTAVDPTTFQAQAKSILDAYMEIGKGIGKIVIGGGAAGGGGTSKDDVLEDYKNQKAILDHRIEMSEKAQELTEEGTEAYKTEQEKQYEIYKETAELISAEMERLKKLGYKTTSDEMMQLEADAAEIKSKMYSLQKSMWTSARDAAVKALEKQKDALDDAYEAAKKYYDYQIKQISTVIGLYQQQYDLTKEISSARLDLEHQYKQAQDAYPSDAHPETLFSSGDYAALMNQLDDIESESTAMWNNYMSQIQAVTANNIAQLDYITSQYEAQYSLKMKEYEIAKSNLAVSKAQIQLENAQKDRNVAMLVNGRWTWVADPDAIKNAMDALYEAENSKADAESDYIYQQKLNEYNNFKATLQLQADLADEQHDKIMDQLEKQIAALNDQLFAFNQSISNLLQYNSGVQSAFEALAAAVSEGISAVSAAAAAGAAAAKAGVSASDYGLTSLSKGAKGDEVVVAQTVLESLGYTTGSKSADGVYGSKTESAVKAFQSSAGLKPTGVIDDATWKALAGASKFDMGGVVDYTGPAIVHGAIAPEVMLNNSQAGQLYNLLSGGQLEEIVKNGIYRQIDSIAKLAFSGILKQQTGVDNRGQIFLNGVELKLTQQESDTFLGVIQRVTPLVFSNI